MTATEHVTVVVTFVYHRAEDDATATGTAEAADGGGERSLRDHRVIDIPASTSIADFLCVYVHGSGLCSVPVGAESHYQVLHEGTQVPLTDADLDSLRNRWASLSPPRVRVRLSPVLTSPTWHPLERARFGECREHPVLFAVSVRNLYDSLSNLPDAALKTSEFSRRVPPRVGACASCSKAWWRWWKEVACLPVRGGADLFVYFFSFSRFFVLLAALQNCSVPCEHITSSKELLELVLQHRRNPSIWHQLASSLKGTTVFANSEPWEQFLLTALGHRVVDDNVKGRFVECADFPRATCAAARRVNSNFDRLPAFLLPCLPALRFCLAFLLPCLPALPSCLQPVVSFVSLVVLYLGPAVGRDELFPSNSAATHNAFLAGRRGFVSGPPLGEERFADERVDIFASHVVDDPEL